jgi:two-component sensor histidine kinase
MALTPEDEPAEDSGGAAGGHARQGMSDETLRMLELSHRTKNILSIVQALVNQTLRGDVPLAEARRTLSNRLVAMGNAVDTLLQTAWQGASLEEIVRAGLIHSGSFDGRVRITGPAVPVGSGAAMSLSLVLHELESNAIKYGGLSNESGTVDLRWTVIGPDEGATLTMVWQERNGPTVMPPARHGFGTRLIGSGIARRLGGKTDCRFEPDGLHWTLSAPVAELAT